MQVFVVVALAVLLASVGAAVVAALSLRRSLRGLAAAAGETRARLDPLTEELAAEQAVTMLELDALQRRSGARKASRPRRR